MRLFLDSSVLLGASGSTSAASHEIFNRVESNGWLLIATPYVIEEVLQNLSKLPPSAIANWARIRPTLMLMDDVLTIDRPVLFELARIARFCLVPWPGGECCSRWIESILARW